MTFIPGDCFTLTDEALAIYGERLKGCVFTVKMQCFDRSGYVAVEKALKTAVSDFEMLPHPGPATPEKDTPRPRRKPRTHDYRTPAQLVQAEIYAAIRAHKLPPDEAVQMLMETAQAIQSVILKTEMSKPPLGELSA